MGRKKLHPDIVDRIADMVDTKRNLQRMSPHYIEAEATVKEEMNFRYGWVSEYTMSFNVNVSHFNDVSPGIKALAKLGWHMDDRGMEKADQYGEFNWRLHKELDDGKIQLSLSALVPNESSAEGGECRRVQVNVKTESVETPVYEIQCDGEPVEV